MKRIRIIAICLFAAAVPRAYGQFQATHIVAMEYPGLARFGAIQGTVELTATFEPSGEVRNVTVNSGHPLLSDGAKTALAKWKFSGCRSETCEITVSFSFNLVGLCTAGTNCPTEFEADLPSAVKITAAAFRAIVN